MYELTSLGTIFWETVKAIGSYGFSLLLSNLTIAGMSFRLTCVNGFVIRLFKTIMVDADHVTEFSKMIFRY